MVLPAPLGVGQHVVEAAVVEGSGTYGTPLNCDVKELTNETRVSINLFGTCFCFFRSSQNGIGC